MAGGPFPGDLMSVYGFVETRPPFVIGLAPEASVHCLYDITRIREESNLARLAQSFQTDGGGGNLGLLIGGLPEVAAN
jgi:hypothetical protein